MSRHITSAPTLRGRLLEVSTIDATSGHFVERQPWTRRLGDLLWGIALGWGVALLAIAFVRTP